MDPIAQVLLMRAGATLAPPFDGVTEVTGAYSFSRQMVSSYGGAFYADTSGSVDTLNDQTGNARHLAGVTTGRPTITTAGPNSRAAGLFDGTNDKLVGSTSVTNMLSVTNGYIIVSFLPDAITANDTDSFDNDGVMGNDNAAFGIHLRDIGTPKRAIGNKFAGFHFTLQDDSIQLSTPYVIELYFTPGNFFFCVNNGTPQSTGVGDGQFFAGTNLSLGHTLAASTAWFTGKIFEAGICNDVPASRSTIAANFMTHIGA